MLKKLLTVFLAACLFGCAAAQPAPPTGLTATQPTPYEAVGKPDVKDIHAFAVNKLGGLLILLDIKAACPPGPLKAVLATDSNFKPMFTGCWAQIDDQVAIVWDDDGSVTTEELKGFTFPGGKPL